MFRVKGFRVLGLSYMPRAGRRPTKTVGGGSLKKKIHILDRLGWPARDIYISHPARARLPPKTFSPLGFEFPTLARSRRFQQRAPIFSLEVIYVIANEGMEAIPFMNGRGL